MTMNDAGKQKKKYMHKICLLGVWMALSLNLRSAHNDQ